MADYPLREVACSDDVPAMRLRVLSAVLGVMILLLVTGYVGDAHDRPPAISEASRTANGAGGSQSASEPILTTSVAPTTATSPTTTTTTVPPTTATTVPPTTTTTTTLPPPDIDPSPLPPGFEVDVFPGDDVQELVNAHPVDTTFRLHTGVYRRVTIMPKSRQTFVGDPGAVLDGEGVTEYGIGPATANGVTIRGLVIENYTGSCIERGARGWGRRWTVEGVEARFCDVGIRVKEGGTYRNNYIHHNGVYGMNGTGDDIVVEGNEIAFNRTAPSAPKGDSGGTKFLRTHNLVLRNNHVHDNLGNGLWVDGSNVGALIEHNRVVDNAAVGIFHELGFGPVIRHNHVEGNGWDSTGRAGSGSGILVLATCDAQVYGNTVVGNRNGILGKYADPHPGRDADPFTGEPYVLKNLSVHHNTVTMNQGDTGIIDYATGHPTYQPSWNNRFANNTYTLTPPNGQFFRWTDGTPATASWERLTLSQWQEHHPTDG